MNNIRNFVIIAHIDHGKSTLADRLLEITGTVEARRMKPQYLDQLELERERGITIKMAPVRMVYRPPQIPNPKSEFLNKSQIQNPKSLEFRNSNLEIANSKQEFILNLIDTPGHSDFSYEVSRALAAVEGAVLLVDGSKGIQAQTLSNFRSAKKAGLKIIGAINKIDLNPPRADESARLLAELIEVPENEILRISGKTGQGVPELLAAVVEKVPPPALKKSSSYGASRSLIFDSLYDDHKGIIAFIRVFDGWLKEGDEIKLLATNTKCKIKEIGYFTPQMKSSSGISMGEIGYIATGIKEPALVKIGDTVFKESLSGGKASAELLAGYREPAPVIYVSLYPDGKTQFEDLKKAFERLRLTDSALVFEPDSSEALGRGLKAGFLGQLHFEIATSRLQREFGLEFMASFPSTAYRVSAQGGSASGGKEKKYVIVKDPNDFPDNPDEVFQPMINAEIFCPPDYVSQILGLKEKFHMEIFEIKNLGNNVIIETQMPLAELMRNFDDKIKSLSSGFASFSYEISGESRADVEKLEILVNDEPASALTRIVFKDEAESEARTTVERLKELLPKQQFSQAIQARMKGRIVARETLAAMKKDVTGYLYGGDRTRKMKLWKKQKRGKERLKGISRVVVPTEVFRDLLKR